jgi:hypothetical protein
MHSGRIAVGSPGPLLAHTAIVSPPGEALVFGSPEGIVRNATTDVQVHQDEFISTARNDPLWPVDLHTLSNITIGSLFIRWYTEELYDAVATERLHKQHKSKCACTVEYCKMFLPGGSVIERKPNTVRELDVWRKHLNSWAQMIEMKVAMFINKWRSIWSDGAVVRRNRISTLNVSATQKKLQQIWDDPTSTFASKMEPQVPTVIDNASSYEVIV